MEKLAASGSTSASEAPVLQQLLAPSLCGSASAPVLSAQEPPVQPQPLEARITLDAKPRRSRVQQLPWPLWPHVWPRVPRSCVVLLD